MAPGNRLQLLRHGDERGPVLVRSQNLDRANICLVSMRGVNDGCFVSAKRDHLIVRVRWKDSRPTHRGSSILGATRE